MSDGITEAIEEEGAAAVEVLKRTIHGIGKPRTPERVCDALMEMARRNPSPRGANGHGRTVLAFLFDREGAPPR